MRKALQILFTLSFPLSLTGCDSVLGPCEHETRPAIVVEVRDAVTGAYAASGATGWIERRSIRTDLVRYHHDGNTVFSLAAWGGEGKYTVTVQKPGYADWVRRDVSVDANACGPQTTKVVAQLQPKS